MPPLHRNSSERSLDERYVAMYHLLLYSFIIIILWLSSVGANSVDMWKGFSDKSTFPQDHQLIDISPVTTNEEESIKGAFKGV